MQTKVFRAPKKRALEIVGNSIIKREAEASYYDGEVFGFEKGTVVIVKAEPEIFKMNIFDDLKEAEHPEQILKKVKELEDRSAMGVGALFG